ncbi:hypothetical protein CEUSTIGMA_g5362.t1 [Chlamydomonas eustigma]|uniref:G-patch domain-containing protein n=1 Tax=Chlamydomonas eustigma TaxID=1157962 RepID=A0A250X582_9CHLO|nr:hypothetical protein CEUSTIGMA_g5362.t1 [Chlamydomonas eustigma]|eukprot:GAX77920.1 hypothetical protein CEUSTIGMA_g5362.t1 [Chlamydomonas eustigma]
MTGMEESDEDEYCYYGTAIKEKSEGKSAAHRKPIQDQAAVRSLPVWQQEPTDEQGRKRFHGAFTGGFSAGYYNTVGSVEGFEPATFKSSRSERAGAKQQNIDDFLDADELEERKRTHLHVRSDYDTFGTAAAELAISEAQRDSESRPSIIPGGLLEEVVVPVANSVGMHLLQRMGWRPGRGIGTASSSRGPEVAGSKWGTVSGVSLDNTPLYVLLPKMDVHGLGFDPFRNADDFREIKRRKVEAKSEALRNSAKGTFAGTASATGGAMRGMGPASASNHPRRGRGVAFGTGVLDEDDGSFEDYVDEVFEDPGGASDQSDQEGEGLLGGSSRGAKVGIGALFGLKGNKGGGADGRFKALPVSGASGRRALALAEQGYSYQLGDSEEEEEGPVQARGRRRPLLLGDNDEASQLPMLQSAKDFLKGGDFIPGFKRSDEKVVLKSYPPPEVPKSFIPKHVFPPAASHAPGTNPHQPGVNLAAAASSPMEVPPPADPLLRKEADSLAALVARSGQALEDLARKQVAASAKQQQQDPGRSAADDSSNSRIKFSFLLEGGAGDPAAAHAAMYYAWRLHKIRTALEAFSGGGGSKLPDSSKRSWDMQQQQQQQGSSERRQGLSVEERLAILGEVPLPPGNVQRDQETAATAVGISAGDKNRLLEALQGNFVKAEVQDMSADAAKTLQVGLRQGGAAAAGTAMAGAPILRGSAAAAAAMLASFGSRFATGGSSETATLQPQGQGGLQAPSTLAPTSKQQCQQQPVRTFEEWRPEPLMCRRFNVPDPYHGKEAPAAVPSGSRFRSDGLLLLSEEAPTKAAQLPMPPHHQMLPQLPVQLVPPGPLPIIAPGLSSGSASSFPPPPPLTHPGGVAAWSAARAAHNAAVQAGMPPPLAVARAASALNMPGLLSKDFQVAAVQKYNQTVAGGSSLGGASGLIDAKAMAADFLSSLPDVFLDEEVTNPADTYQPGGEPTASERSVGERAVDDKGEALKIEAAGEAADARARPRGLVSEGSSEGAASRTVVTVESLVSAAPFAKPTVTMDRPLDLFKAIFEADEDDEEVEEEPEESVEQGNAGDELIGLKQGQAVVHHGGGEGGGNKALQTTFTDADNYPEAGTTAAGHASSVSSVGPAKALADALLRAQALSKKSAEEASKARAGSTQQLVLGLPSTLEKAAGTAMGNGVSLPSTSQHDPAMQQRIFEALAVLKDIKKSKNSKKHKKHGSKGKKHKKDEKKKSSSKGLSKKHRKSSSRKKDDVKRTKESKQQQRDGLRDDTHKQQETHDGRFKGQKDEKCKESSAAASSSTTEDSHSDQDSPNSPVVSRRSSSSVSAD